MKRYLPALVIMITLVLGAGSAHAIPGLQLFIEGATYDTGSETWVYEPDGGDIILWVIGDVGSYGKISDVKLVAAVESDEDGKITLSGTVGSSTYGILDTSLAGTPGEPKFWEDSVPVLSDEGELPTHGIYPSDFYQWDLGDFTLDDSPIGDFTQGGCPYDLNCSYPDQGQINAYLVEIEGYSWVHFDVFDEISLMSKEKSIFAPFSHDAEVPEPNSLLLVGSGLLVLGLMRRRFIK